MYVGRYRDILQPACCNGSQTRDKEEEDLEIFSMYIGKYKCTIIIAKIRCSSETVIVSFDPACARLDAEISVEDPSPCFSNH